MASVALASWQGDRATHLDELLEAHGLVGGQSRGRRWRTTQLNHSLTLLLAAEFQGFARDLHDLASSTFASWAAPTNPTLQGVIEARLTDGRLLDRGNAQASSLGSDFGRFGFSLWPVLAARNPDAKVRQARLEALNVARNAIAHADAGALAGLRAQGYPMTLQTIRIWRTSLDRLAGSLDVEVAGQLGQLFGRPPPW